MLTPTATTPRPSSPVPPPRVPPLLVLLFVSGVALAVGTWFSQFGIGATRSLPANRSPSDASPRATLEDQIDAGYETLHALEGAVSASDRWWQQRLDLLLSPSGVPLTASEDFVRRFLALDRTPHVLRHDLEALPAEVRQRVDDLERARRVGDAAVDSPRETLAYFQAVRSTAEAAEAEYTEKLRASDALLRDAHAHPASPRYASLNDAIVAFKRKANASTVAPPDS